MNVKYVEVHDRDDGCKMLIDTTKVLLVMEAVGGHAVIDFGVDLGPKPYAVVTLESYDKIKNLFIGER